MDIRRLLNLPCTIHTVTESTADAYGDPTLTTSNTSALCWIDRRGNLGDGSEETGPTNWQTDTLDLYLDAGTTITGNDRVTVASVLYEVVGPPHEHLHPRTGDGAYVSAVIRRVS